MTSPAPGSGPPDGAAPDPRPRPMIERLGMALLALVLASLFAVVAVAAFAGGEPFLGAMGALGCLMVLWVGGLTLFPPRHGGLRTRSPRWSYTAPKARIGPRPPSYPGDR
jgi:uncharacterized RDD family membrane protein YckC